MTLKVDVPSVKLFNKSLLEKQLSAFAKMLLSYPFAKAFENCDEGIMEAKEDDIHIFDCLHKDWGGDKSAEEIAEDIRNSRIERSVEVW
ncbi:MAG: hypothetical protein MJZ66_04380 [Bacteroidales bacterium]|nr:hypothetical protein [Bacteroidales bacterium]